jgi:hypothetical protein
MSTENSEKYQKLCIPRGMTFQTPEFVERAFNMAMQGKFVKNIDCKPTKDHNGKEFVTFFITPNQDFRENASTELIYKNLREQGYVNISTGKGHYFWKVKLYVPNLKAKYIQEKPASAAPKIMTDEDTIEFRRWQEQRNAAKAAKAAAAETGPWETEVAEVVEEGELSD